MRAILCNDFRGVEALSFADASDPRPGPNEVLVDIHAASVSYMDYLMTTGLYQLRPPLPYVPGTDAAGIVLACGDQVTRFRVGDRVCCGNWFGGFAERMVARESSVALLPDNVDFMVGSTVLNTYLTAWYALIERARLQAGETVLVTGARRRRSRLRRDCATDRRAGDRGRRRRRKGGHAPYPCQFPWRSRSHRRLMPGRA